MPASPVVSVLLRLAALVTIITAPMSAQVGGIIGVVRDSANGAPISNAEVRLFPDRSTRSDRDGQWRFDAVTANSYQVSVRLPGYAPRNYAVVVRAGEITTLTVNLNAVATELTPIVVTATRDARSLADVPVAVSVADSVTIQSGRTAGLHEVLRLTPGMQATSRFGLDDVNLSIRGSGVRTTFGVRGVAVVVDGVPVTEPDGQTRLDIIELGSARQVEIVRGPASALYGGTASGGVVNIISRSAADASGATFRASGGSFGFRKYDASLGVSTSDRRAGMYLSGTWTESDGFRSHNSNLMKRVNLRSEWQAASQTRLSLEASASDLDMKIPGALTSAELTDNPFGAEANTVVNNHGRRDVRWRTGLKLTQGVSIMGQQSELTAYGFHGGRELDHPIFQVVDQNLHRTQLGARLALPFTTGWRVTTGVDHDVLYGAAERYVNQGGNRGALTVAQDTDIPSLGIYSQLEGRLTERLGFTFGARWDQVEYGVTDLLNPAKSARPSFTQVSPKGTLSLKLGEGAAAYASVARGFDVPTLSEMTASADPTLGFNPELGAKRLWNYEVGVKSLVGGTFFVDGSVYHQAITGEILPRTVQVGGQGVTIYENAGNSHHWGAELAVTAYLTPDIDLGASYTWSRFVLRDFAGTVTGSDGNPVTVDFAGNRLPGVPEHRMAAEFRIRPIQQLQLGVTAEWQSRLFVDNGNTESGVVYVRGFGPQPSITAVPFKQVDSWGLVHLAASYQLAGQRLFLSVENLFDTRYVANSTLNASNGRFYSVGAGRYIAAGVSLSAFGRNQ